jgi:hypothetical protein
MVPPVDRYISDKEAQDRAKEFITHKQVGGGTDDLPPWAHAAPSQVGGGADAAPSWACAALPGGALGLDLGAANTGGTPSTEGQARFPPGYFNSFASGAPVSAGHTRKQRGLADKVAGGAPASAGQARTTNKATSGAPATVGHTRVPTTSAKATTAACGDSAPPRVSSVALKISFETGSKEDT